MFGFKSLRAVLEPANMEEEHDEAPQQYGGRQFPAHLKPGKLPYLCKLYRAIPEKFCATCSALEGLDQALIRGKGNNGGLEQVSSATKLKPTARVRVAVVFLQHAEIHL